MGPKTMMAAAIKQLHALEVCHIEDYSKQSEKDLDIGSPLEDSESLSGVIVASRAVQATLSQYSASNKKDAAAKNASSSNLAGFLKEADKNVQAIQKQTVAILEKIRGIDDQLRAVTDEIKQLRSVAPLNIDLATFTQYDSLEYFVGNLDPGKNFKDRLNKVTRKNRLFIAVDSEGRTVIALFVDRNDAHAVQELLAEHKFSSFDTAALEAKKGKPSVLLSAAKNKEKEFAKKRSQYEDDLSAFAKRSMPYLAVVDEVIGIELEKAEAPLRFAVTESSFVLKGWISTKKEQSVKKALNDATGSKLYIVTDAIKEQRKHETIPIKFNNPKFVRPFEFFMNLYTLPQYKEIDPTFLMFLTFPIFYGFMLGDIGYGIITLGLFLWLRTKIKGAFGKLVNAMIYGSIATIFFGALFGEFFGLEEIGHFALPHILSRAHDINELMLLALALGVVHVNIGLIIGFYNVWRAHGFIHALNEKVSWMVLEVAAACLAMAYTEYIPVSVGPNIGYIGIVLFILAVVMLYKGEGVKGLIELPAIFTNVLSYARLMAVGLASVILATVVNEFAGQMFHSGIIGIISGIILLVIGHGINIMLGLISPFLHSTRLHYVEFFTKFYEGGGTKFMPFGAKEEE